MAVHNLTQARGQLNRTIYFSLATLLILVAFLSAIAGVWLESTLASHKDRFATRQREIQNLYKLQAELQKTDKRLQNWFLHKNIVFNYDNILIWSAEISKIQLELYESARTWSDTIPKAKLQSLFEEKLTYLKGDFRKIGLLLPNSAAFENENLYRQAIELYIVAYQPVALETQELIDKLIMDRQLAAQYENQKIENALWIFKWLIFCVIIATAIIILYIGYYLIKVVTRPLFTLREFLQVWTNGDFPVYDLPAMLYEPGEIAQSLNTILQQYKRTDTALRLLINEKSEIPEALINSPNPLNSTLLALYEQIRILKDREEKRKWNLEGLERFNEILRKNTNLQSLCEEITSNVVRFLQANLGAIFLIEEQNQDNQPILSMVASYAYNRRHNVERKFRLGEGLVGQAALEHEILHITSVPENYVIMSSGLGQAAPAALLIVPLIANHQLCGVIELASFHHFTEGEILFTKKLAENVANAILNLRNNEKNLILLKNTRQMRDELVTQAGQLKQNAEVMLSTQKQLEQTNAQFEKQMQKLNHTATELARSEKRFYTLLENASEIISIFEADASVRFHSPSIHRILGYAPDEVRAYHRFVVSDDIQLLQHFFQQLVQQPEVPLTIQYRYRRKNGTIVYLESVGKNLLHDPSIRGLVLNTRSIDERIRADQNTQRRILFQSLTENLPDLIIRYDLNGRYLYVNSVIERYTNNQAEYFLSHSIYDVGLSQQEIRFWENLINSVVSSRTKKRVEMNMPSIIGDRVMQVEMVPEFGEGSYEGVNVETLMVVAHDITEMKQAELKIRAQNQKLEQINQEVIIQKREIEEKNKDITESIQYAKRIQEAILPDITYIRSYLKDFFIIYIPKDIVSGDFYWFSAVGNKIFIAIVDCTGHGVPGAFMSLIGNNQLNRIVNEQSIAEPGVILDTLHKNVNEALNQSYSGEIPKDGMDIALCRIEPDKKLIYFAGANRPLYWWHEYELVEIKGDKKGIGGGNKEDVKFTTHTLQYKSGDAIYLFSDGYVDQFGGNNGKKLTPKRLREVLINNQHKTMADLKKVVEKNFYDWKGTQTQVDDVVILGGRL